MWNELLHSFQNDFKHILDLKRDHDYAIRKVLSN